MSEHDPKQTKREFDKAVNMSPAELERWLQTGESKSVGWTHEGDHESVGHQSGRRIIELTRKRSSDLDSGDLAHMRKVIGYVHRHLAQRPEGDIRETRWRYSLMNWGHDPMKGTR